MVNDQDPEVETGRHKNKKRRVYLQNLIGRKDVFRVMLDRLRKLTITRLSNDNEHTDCGKRKDNCKNGNSRGPVARYFVIRFDRL